jgi:hypothetical protein
MRETLVKYAHAHKRELVTALIATIIFIVYQSSPAIGATINLLTLEMVPGVASLGEGSAIILGYLLQFIPIALFCVITALMYYLLRVKQSTLTAVVGFVVSYVFTSWLALFVSSSVLIRIGSGVVVYVLFFVSLRAFSKSKWHATIPVIIGGMLIFATLFLTPYITRQIENGQYETKDKQLFQSAVNNLDFTAYYPTYSSSSFLASPAKLNGYSKPPYSNETVSFLLGKAQVRESERLVDQDKVMNFVNNCDINAIRFSMETSSRITDFNLQSSLDNFKKCNLIHTTPSGIKVYFESNGQLTDFYMLVNNTNIVITFDDINTQKYDSAQLPEILKIIDSLHTISAAKLQKGNTSGFGFE